MTDVYFYHLTRTSLEEALPVLLEKTLERNWKAVVMADSEERVEDLTQHLWTYRPDRFLPHGSNKDGVPDRQPIWLTAIDERPNAADVLFLVVPAESQHYDDFMRVCLLFDGHDPHQLDVARSRWAQFKTLNYKLSYWQQGDKGWYKAQ